MYCKFQILLRRVVWRFPGLELQSKYNQSSSNQTEGGSACALPVAECFFLL